MFGAAPGSCPVPDATPSSAGAPAVAGADRGRVIAPTGGTGTDISPQEVEGGVGEGEGEGGGEGAQLLAMLRDIKARESSNAVGLSSPATPLPRDGTMPLARPPSFLVADTSEGLVDEADRASNDATPADGVPFGIFPGYAVVPANGEVSFEVAFSPATLGEAR